MSGSKTTSNLPLNPGETVSQGPFQTHRGGTVLSHIIQTTGPNTQEHPTLPVVPKRTKSGKMNM